MDSRSERRIRTACAANCGGRAFLECTVRDDVLVKTEPAPYPDPRYTGACVRCLTLPQWVYSEERITEPMRRVGARGTGELEPVGWDEALDEITGRFRAIAGSCGGEAIAFTRTSGASSLGDFSRLAALLGATTFYGGVDMAVHMGLNASFGFRGTFGQSANEWTDRSRARTILIWGNNPAETSMTSFRFLLDAQRAGSRLVVIDPRYSATAIHADWWVAPRPGTDIALALGMIRVILEEDLIDPGFAARHSVAPLLVRASDGRFLHSTDLEGYEGVPDYMVWDGHLDGPVPVDRSQAPVLSGSFSPEGIRCSTALRLLEEAVKDMAPERVASITGVPATDVIELARTYATSGPSTIAFGYGVDRYLYADMLTRAGAALAALTGNLGRPGAGVGVQSHGIGAATARFAAPASLPGWAHSRSVPNIEVATRDLGVRALFCQGDWLNQRVPDMSTLVDLVRELELVVTVDHFWQTTTKWSDFVLPASTFLEGTEPYRDLDTAFNSVLLRSTVIAPVGNSRPDSDIERELAARLGLGEYYEDSTEEMLRRQIDESSDPALEGISFDDLVAAGGGLRLKVGNAPRVQYEDLIFDTPTGRIEFYQEALAASGEAIPVHKTDFEADMGSEVAAALPIVLTQNHVRQRAHSTFFNTRWTLELWPEPIVEMSPADAGSRGLETGDTARIWNRRGSVEAVVVVNPDYPEGMANVSEGWKQDQFRSGNLQELTNPRINKAQKLMWGHSNIAFYDTRVEIGPADSR